MRRWMCWVMMSMLLCLSAGARSQDSEVQEARQLHEQAVALYKSSNDQQALPLAKRALEIRERVLGSEHLDTAASMRNLAQLYRVTNDYSRAEELCKRVLEIRERLAGPQHLDTAESLQDLANIYYTTGAYASAEPLYQRALAIRATVLGPEHPSVAESLRGVTRAFRQLGRYAQAEPLARRAVAIDEKVFGTEHPNTANSLLQLGNLQVSMGAYASAEASFQRALAIQEKVRGPEHPDTADPLMGLAVVYDATGAHRQAVTLLLRALAIREKVAGSEDMKTAGVLNNLAMAYAQAGDSASAETYFQRAVLVGEKAGGPEHPQVVDSLNNMALVYAQLGQLAKAEPLYQRTLAITVKQYGEEDRRTAAMLHNLAKLYRVSGAYSKSESLHLRALAIYEKILGPEHPFVANVLFSLGTLYWTAGKLGKALPRFQQARQIGAKNSERFLASGSESRTQAYLDESAAEVFKNVSFAISVGGRDAAVLGLTSVLQYKGRALDAASDSAARLRQSVRSEDRAVFEQLSQVAAELSMLTYQGSGNLSLQALRQRIGELSMRQEALEAQLASSSSRFRQQVMPTTFEAVRRALPADAVLVEWFRYRPFDPTAKSTAEEFGAPRYAAYVLGRSGDPLAIDLGAAADIDALVSEFRAAAGKSSNSEVPQRSAALSRKILEPLRVHIGRARHLLLSPDAALNLVPMAALLDERGRYLVERYEISYLTSGRDLLRIANREAVSSSNAVVMADPDYGPRLRIAQTEGPMGTGQERSEELDRGGLSFRSLPGTALEAAAINQLLQPESARLLTGEQASETNLKRVHGPRILHLATHGFFLTDQELRAAGSRSTAATGGFLTENPLLRSGLALAGANQRRSGFSDDGILTALEASRLDLQGTELVVLSACETGVGEINAGVGVTGLRRGLLLAGAQAQISSLWKVADLPTQELMVSFYQHLVKGAGPAAALRRAQREMLERPARTHPYYWAGFVPIGDWAPLASL